MTRSLALVTALLLATTCFADAPPAAAPAVKDDGFSLGEVRMMTFPPATIIAGSSETTFDKLMEVIQKYIPQLSKGIDEGTIRPAGVCVFVYKGMSEDMSKPFGVEIGWFVSDKTKDQGELKVRKTEAFKCATIILTGAVSNMSKAYEKLMPVANAKYTPTGEVRELYLYWEGADSPNNIIQIQVGVK
jgi:effector-binding domain-containing protein